MLRAFSLSKEKLLLRSLKAAGDILPVNDRPDGLQAQ